MTTSRTWANYIYNKERTVTVNIQLTVPVEFFEINFTIEKPKD